MRTILLTPPKRCIPAIIILALMFVTFLPLTGRSGNVPTDGGGTITTGGTSQVIFAANESRRSFEFQNTSDTVMYLDFGQAATSTLTKSFTVAPGGFYAHVSNFPYTTSINVLCATTGKTFVAKQGP